MPPPPRRSSSAARLSCASGGSNAGRSPTAWRKPASASSPSLDCRSANGDRHERPTPSSACTRSSSAGSRRRPCCHRPRRRPCCSGRCWHPARSRCARSTAGRPWPSPPRRSRLTSPPDPTTLPAPETTLSQFQPHPRRHLRQQGFSSAYLFGAVCPERGEGVALVLPEVSTAAMDVFLAELSRAVPAGTHAALVLDGAGCHVSEDLTVPPNLTLIHPPPYSPELDPVE